MSRPRAGPDRDTLCPMNQYPNPYSPMSSVQSVMVQRSRPRALTVAVTFWIVAGLCWPVGILVRELVVVANPGSGEAPSPPGWVLMMFGFAVLAIAECWLGLLLRAGHWYARLALAFGAVLCETVVLVALIQAVATGLEYRDGAAIAWWLVMSVWAVLGPVALVCSFVPSVNAYLNARR